MEAQKVLMNFRRSKGRSFWQAPDTVIVKLEYLAVYTKNMYNINTYMWNDIILHTPQEDIYMWVARKVQPLSVGSFSVMSMCSHVLVVLSCMCTELLPLEHTAVRASGTGSEMRSDRILCFTPSSTFEPVSFNLHWMLSPVSAWWFQLTKDK